MLHKKVAVITGASSGIGAALASLLAKSGSSVVLAARRADRLAEVERTIRAAGGTVDTIPCDVTIRADAEALIARTVDRHGRLDILVNNAGRGHCGSVEDTSDEVIEHMFATNVYSLWYTTRPALLHMRKQKSGHIINVASIAGKLGYPYNSAYVAAKHACVGFTHALRSELMETGIHASVVCPAGVKTDWASSTEGGDMLQFFSRSGPAIKRIAAERGLPLPPVEGVKTAEAVAAQILECIYHPVAEVFTHTGSHEFVALAAQRWEEAERFQLAVALGEREAYEEFRKKS